MMAMTITGTKGTAQRWAGLLASGLCCLLLAGPVAAQQRQVPASQADVQLSYSPLVKKVTPAVVNVYASRVIPQRPRLPFEDPLFQEFFGGPTPYMPRERMQRALGSGVLVGAEGLVVTNNHVIQGMTDVRVSLVDQREFDADIVLTDAQSDIAVLRLRDGKGGFPILPLVETDSIEVGDIVLAVGNPFGLGQTVTQGILSAVRRVQKKGGEQAVYLRDRHRRDRAISAARLSTCGSASSASTPRSSRSPAARTASVRGTGVGSWLCCRCGAGRGQGGAAAVARGGTAVRDA